MRSAIQIKVLVAILALLVVITVLIRKGGDVVPVAPSDRQLQKKLNDKTKPSDHRYLVP